MRPLLLSLLLLVPLSAHAVTTPAQNCQSGKNKEIAKYAACRQQAEAKYAVKPDAAARTAALQKCLDKYVAKWPGLESKAADKGGLCPSTGDQNTIRSAADYYTNNVATALGGGALSSCPADLASCEADDASCQADLARCQGVLAGAVCGNGTLDAGEQCDVGALNGRTCATEGFVGGTLRCVTGCTLDTSGCWSARFVDNGNGTVTDRQTGLQWEKKTTTFGSGPNQVGDVHDVDNVFTWFSAPPLEYLVWQGFLGRLNGSSSLNGAVISQQPCFAGRCDWRLPTITELKSIVDMTAPGCGTGSACIDPAFGPTAVDLPLLPKHYWSWTIDPLSGSNPPYMWTVDFTTGTVVSDDTIEDDFTLRAVRAGNPFTWIVGNWGACSATCGGGQQTRSVACQSNLGETVTPNVTVCLDAGPKPAAIQSCNTNPC